MEVTCGGIQVKPRWILYQRLCGINPVENPARWTLAQFEIWEWIDGPNRFVSDHDTLINFSFHHGTLFRKLLDLPVPNKTLWSKRYFRV